MSNAITNWFFKGQNTRIPNEAAASWGDLFIDDWKQRDKFEPLVEMFQVKGSSECSTFFGSTDEECNFEQFFPPCNRRKSP